MQLIEMNLQNRQRPAQGNLFFVRAPNKCAACKWDTAIKWLGLHPPKAVLAGHNMGWSAHRHVEVSKQCDLLIKNFSQVSNYLNRSQHDQQSWNCKYIGSSSSNRSLCRPIRTTEWSHVRKSSGRFTFLVSDYQGMFSCFMIVLPMLKRCWKPQVDALGVEQLVQWWLMAYQSFSKTGRWPSLHTTAPSLPRTHGCSPQQCQWTSWATVTEYRT